MNALAVSLLLGASVARPTPIAVMPFKNLNGDPSMAWLENGIAETMLSDLRRVAKVPIVERAQVDRAIAEMKLQAAGETEESTAVRVGRLVGAKTLVVGAVQKAGEQLRITARFVNVETGEVLDTAKATGPLSSVFALQDEIVSSLVGEPMAKARAAPRKTTPHTLKAYKLYSMATSVVSDAERLVYLKEAVSEDPEFDYATEAIEQLEGRMRGYRTANHRALEEQEKQLLAMLDDPKAPRDQVAQRAQSYLNSLMTGRLYRAIPRVAQRVAASDLPPVGTLDLHEFAAYSEVYAYYLLQDIPRFLKTGEAFLKKFPASQFYSPIDALMSSALNEQRVVAEGKADYAAEREKNEDERKKAEANAAERKHPLDVGVEASFDYRRCSTAIQFHQHEETLKECGAFVAKWRGQKLDGSSADTVSTEIVIALMSRGHAYRSLGKLDEARATWMSLIESEPKIATQWNIRGLMQLLPAD